LHTPVEKDKWMMWGVFVAFSDNHNIPDSENQCNKESFISFSFKAVHWYYEQRGKYHKVSLKRKTGDRRTTGFVGMAQATGLY